MLTVAELAGVMGAKRTSDLIPLCHPIPLTDLVVAITPDRAPACCGSAPRPPPPGPTGVEMEAMTAARSPPYRVRHGQGRRARRRDPQRPPGVEERRQVRRVASPGRRPRTRPDRAAQPGVRKAARVGKRKPGMTSARAAASRRTALVLTVSDRSLRGHARGRVRRPAGGAADRARLRGRATVGAGRHRRGSHGARRRGGPPSAGRQHRRDRPDAARRDAPGHAGLLDYEVPGIAEAMRADGRGAHAARRPVAGPRGRSRRLPGRQRARHAQGAPWSRSRSLEPILVHALETLAGPFDHAAGRAAGRDDLPPGSPDA